MLINEAESAFKDARTSTWRYFVLNETSQRYKITVSAEQAVQKLNYGAPVRRWKSPCPKASTSCRAGDRVHRDLKSTTDAHRGAEPDSGPGGPNTTEAAAARRIGAGRSQNASHLSEESAPGRLRPGCSGGCGRAS